MKLIEFVGMPRAGKSTQINLLCKALRKRGHTVKVITDRFRASQIKTPPSEVIAYKLVFYAKALEDYIKSKNKYDYVIVDRGFYDSVIWFDVEKILKHITPKRAAELKNTFVEFMKQVDKTVCLMVDVSEATRRHTKTKHMKVDDVGMRKEYLIALKKSYQQNKRKLGNCLYTTVLDSPEALHERILKFVSSARESNKALGGGTLWE